ncbi:MAG: thioesterase family protein [Oscillospiraceae bacterium]|jgi:predicted thioesterase|nr:thioesterase family protein [Oscillospiraceae bacterium]
MDIKVGTEYTSATTVDQSNIASAVGSGLVDVFATPMMIALMELAASECIKPFLESGQASVGTQVNVSHSDATPVGMKVFATAKVVAVDRRRVDFDVKMRDEAGEIGRGTHTRFIIDTEKFMTKAALKGRKA